MLTSQIEDDIENIVSSALPWERFAGKCILISGAAGFLATYLVETLLALRAIGKGPRLVVGLVRNMPKAQLRFGHHAERQDFELVECDLAEPLALDRKIDFIIHAASQASPKFYIADPIGTLKPNTLGTYQLLLRAVADKTEGFLFLSSAEVYGQTTAASIVEDDYGYLDPSDVRSCYAESKRMGETLCVSAHHQFGTTTYIARLFHTYGPGLAVDDGRVFSDFIADIIQHRDFTIKSDGTARRAFCYVTDAVIGLFTILLKGQPARPYNVGNDQAEVSIIELAEILVTTFLDRNLKIIVDPSKSGPTYAKSPVSRICPNVGALRSIGWKPNICISDGFKRTVRSIEEECNRPSKVTDTR